MRTLAGSDALVRFAHLSKASCDALTSSFDEPQSQARPSTSAPSRFICSQEGVLELMKESGTPLQKVCLLDPKAEQVLSPEDGDGRFDWFLFGVRSLR